jgi:hypothetical protein
MANLQMSENSIRVKKPSDMFRIQKMANLQKSEKVQKPNGLFRVQDMATLQR